MVDQDQSKNKPTVDEIIKATSEIYSKKKELNLDEISVEMECIKYDEIELIISITGNLPTVKKEKVNEFDEFLTNYKNYEIKNRVKLQDPRFIKVSNLINLSTGEKVDYEHSKGEVVLIDVWATWCGPCQQPMSHNQEMLEKNEENWKGKVRILGISVDEEIEDIRKRVEEKKWNKVEHYQLEGGWSHQLMSTYEINGIPKIFLLDKQGEIKYNGHPFSINLEKSINDLLEDKPIKLKEEKNSESPETPKQILISYDEFSSLWEKLKDIKNQNEELFANLKRFEVLKRVDKSLNDENFQNMNVKASFMIIVFDKSETKERISKIKELYQDYKISVGNKADVILRFYFESEKKYEKKPIPLTCCKCQKSLSVEDYRLFCIVCHNEGKENYTFCKECVPDPDNEDFDNNPIHEHHLYYLPPNTEEVFNSAKNLKYLSELDKNPPEDKIVRRFFCDNCRGKIPICNWSCGVCTQNVNSSYDLCNSCFKISQDENHPEYINLKLAEGEHDPKNHPMARIPYNISIIYSGPEEI